MRIVVFGATGRTGRHLVEQSLAQGHLVTAFVRPPGKLPIQHPRLRIAQGDVLDGEAVEKAVEGQEIVLCALGRNRGEPTTALAEGTHHIIRAMHTHGVRRILCVSAAGFLGERADFVPGKILFWYFRRYLKRLLETMRLQFVELEQSGLEWVAVRPVLLSDGPRTGHYRVVRAGVPTRGYRIRTGDVADFMLRQISSDEFVRSAPAIAY